MSDTSYYQRNGEVIINRAKDYYENNKELLTNREQKISIESYLKKKKIWKIWKENMEKTDIIICLNRKSKN